MEDNADFQNRGLILAGLSHAHVSTSVVSHADDRPLFLLWRIADLQRYLSQGLSAGYRAALALNGQEGIDAALRGTTDLIVFDLMMPKVDGITLVKQLNR